MRRSVFCPATLVQLVITLFLTQQCFGVTREFAQTYPLRSGGSLELNNVNGTVHIEAWDKDVVEVRAVKTTSEKESNLDRVSIDVDSKPDGGLSISTHYPQEEGGGSSCGLHGACAAERSGNARQYSEWFAACDGPGVGG